MSLWPESDRWGHFNPQVNTQKVYSPQTNKPTPTTAVNACNRIEDSFSQATVRPAVWALPLVVIQLDRQGGQENLRYSKPELGQDKYQ